MMRIFYQSGTMLEPNRMHLTRKSAEQRAARILGKTWRERGYFVADENDEFQKWRPNYGRKI